MMKDAARFWDKIADKYARSPVRDAEAYRQKLEITRRYLNLHSEVFEFGCGTGTTAIAHAPFVKRILAIDISPKMLGIAEARAAAEGVENISFVQSSIEEFTCDDERFDVVMGHSILHLLTNPQSAIDKAFRLLKPGGAFVTSTICLGDEARFWRLILPLLQFVGVAPTVQSLSRQGLAAMFLAAGFNIDYQLEQQKRMQAAFYIVRKPDQRPPNGA